RGSRRGAKEHRAGIGGLRQDGSQLGACCRLSTQDWDGCRCRGGGGLRQHWKAVPSLDLLRREARLPTGTLVPAAASQRDRLQAAEAAAVRWFECHGSAGSRLGVGWRGGPGGRPFDSPPGGCVLSSKTSASLRMAPVLTTYWTRTGWAGLKALTDPSDLPSAPITCTVGPALNVTGPAAVATISFAALSSTEATVPQSHFIWSVASTTLGAGNGRAVKISSAAPAAFMLFP